MRVCTGTVDPFKRIQELEQLLAHERAKIAQLQASGTLPGPAQQGNITGGSEFKPTLCGVPLCDDVCHVGSLEGLDMRSIRLKPTLVTLAAEQVGCGMVIADKDKVLHSAGGKHCARPGGRIFLNGCYWHCIEGMKPMTYWFLTFGISAIRTCLLAY